MTTLDNKSPDIQRSWVLIWIITLLGLVLRAAYISCWSLSGDEWYTFEHSLKIFDGETPIKNLSSGVKFYPLIYLITRLESVLFGLSELSIRIVPCLLGALAPPVFYCLTKKSADESSALYGALFIAISPWLVLYSQTARFYSGVFLFGTLSIFHLYQGIAENHRKKVLSGTLFLAIAMLFHPSAVTILLVNLVFIFTIKRVHPSAPPIAFKRYLPIWTLLIIITLAPLLNLKAFMDTVVSGVSNNPNWAYSTLHLLLGLIQNAGYGFFLTAVFGGVALFMNHRVLGFYLILCFGGSLFCYLVMSIFGISTHQRYLMPIMPAFFLLAGYGCAYITQGLWKKNKALYAGAVLVVLFPCLPSLISYYKDGNRMDFKGAADYIARRLNSTDLIFCESHKILEHYLNSNVKRGSADTIKDNQIIETSLELKGQKLETLIETSKRIWVVVPERRFETEEFLDPQLTDFIKKRCVLETHIFKPRFDYHQNVLRIYLFENGGARK